MNETQAEVLIAAGFVAWLGVLFWFAGRAGDNYDKPNVRRKYDAGAILWASLLFVALFLAAGQK